MPRRRGGSWLVATADYTSPYRSTSFSPTSTNRTYCPTDILLNQYHTRRYKIGRLLEWIPRNGRDGLDRFIVCLRRSSREAPGHGELADILEHDRNSPNPDTGLRITVPELPLVRSKQMIDSNN